MATQTASETANDYNLSTYYKRTLSLNRALIMLVKTHFKKNLDHKIIVLLLEGNNPVNFSPIYLRTNITANKLDMNKD